MICRPLSLASIYSNNKLDRKYLCVFFAVLALKRQKGVLHAYVGTTFICPKNYHTYTQSFYMNHHCSCRRPWRTANWSTLHFMCGIETHYVLAGGSWTMNAFVLFRSKREPTFIKPSIPCLKFLVLQYRPNNEAFSAFQNFLFVFNLQRRIP